MKLLKVLFLTLLFVLSMIVAVQNADLLSGRMPLTLAWPGTEPLQFELPILALIAILFVAGFVLTSLKYMGELLGLGRTVAARERSIISLEQELRSRNMPQSSPAQERSADQTDLRQQADRQIVDQQGGAPAPDRASAMHIASPESSPQTFQIPLEPAMETTSAPAAPEQKTSFTNDAQETLDQDILVRQSGPGWAAVVLLSAALALVVSSAVYIVLNDQLSGFTGQLSELNVQTGHLSSAQEEMGRAWEQERTVLREEIGALDQGQTQLAESVDSLEEQMQVLQGLPEVVRKRLVAGFLRDAAGKTAFLETQVETDEHRETLEQVQEMLNSLALELEGDN